MSTPYLTESEERGHAKARKYEDYRMWREKVTKRCGVKNIKQIPFAEIQSQHN